MTLDDLGLPEEDRQEIRAALLTWKKDGVARPLIPLDHDVNGDGVADFAIRLAGRQRKVRHQQGHEAENGDSIYP